MLGAAHGSHTYPYKRCFCPCPCPCLWALSLSLIPVPCSVPLVPVIWKSVQGCSQQCLYAHSTYNNAYLYKFSASIERAVGIALAQTFPPLLVVSARISFQKGRTKTHPLYTRNDAARRLCNANAIFLAPFCSLVASMPSESPCHPRQEQD